MAQVLLIQPNDDIRNKDLKPLTPPLSLIYVGTAIEGKHLTKIYDRNVYPNDDDFITFLKNYNPNIVGFTSTTTPQLLDIMHLGKLIKNEFPKIIIVVGGVHATVEPDSLLNEPYIDYVVRGEGEEAFLEFCNVFDKNPNKLKSLKNINHNSLRPLLNLNKLKLPNYDLVDIKKYDCFFVGFSRGCVGNCTFCTNVQMWGFNGKPCIRTYNKEKMIELLKEIIEKYDIKNFSIVDDNFLFFKANVISVCNFLKNYNLHFGIASRVDAINDEVLKALKSAGCHTILLGIESGSQRILNLLNKRATVQQNIDAIKCCRRNGLFSDASIMVGLPTETIEDLNETIKFVKNNNPDVPNIKLYGPMPAPLFDYCVAKKLIEKPKTLEDWAKWWTGYGGKISGLRHNISEIPDEYLEKVICDLQNHRFYRRKLLKFIFWLKLGEFKYILKRIKSSFEIKREKSFKEENT